MTWVRRFRADPSRESWPLTPPVTLPLRTDSRADSSRQRQGPFPRTTRQRRCFPDPKRLPPTNPLYPRLALALEPRPRGPPLVLRLCRLSPASDMGSRAGSTRQVRSPSRLSPELWDHMPCVDFCNFRDPRARPPIHQTSLHLRWRTTAQRAAPPPCGFGTSRIATAQGSWLPKDPQRPPRRPHAKTDLPRPVSSGHPSSLADTLRTLEKSHEEQPHGTRYPSRGTNEPGHRAKAR